MTRLACIPYEIRSAKKCIKDYRKVDLAGPSYTLRTMYPYYIPLDMYFQNSIAYQWVTTTHRAFLVELADSAAY